MQDDTPADDTGDDLDPTGETPALDFPEPGTVIAGKYVVAGVLGLGGMGTVLDVQHKSLGRHFALKVLQADGRRDPTALARFTNEARTVSAIGHPNVCNVFDVGALDDGRPFLLMEKLEGETLREKLARLGKLGYPEACVLLVSVLSALEAVHAQGVIHRDIKPANVFCVRQPGLETVKLLDFGVSKVVRSGVSLHLTGTGEVMGTAYYMSPEQARGEEDLDARVDLWACGVMLYEMVAGQRPFVGANFNQIFAAILEDRWARLSEVNPELPPELDAIVSRALAKDRARRYASARELREAITSSGLVPMRFDALPPAGPNSAPELVDCQNRTFRKLASAFGSFSTHFDDAHADGTLTREEITDLQVQLSELEKWARHMQELLARAPVAAVRDDDEDGPATTRADDRDDRNDPTRRR